MTWKSEKLANNFGWTRHFWLLLVELEPCAVSQCSVAL